MHPESTRHRIRLVGAGIATSLSPALHEHEPPRSASPTTATT